MDAHFSDLGAASASALPPGSAARPARDSHLTRVLIMVGVAASVVCSAVIGLQLLPEAAGQSLVYVARIVFAIAAAIAMLAFARRARGRLRRARTLISLALLLGVVNGIAQIVVLKQTGHLPEIPSPVDVIYLLTYPLIVAGLVAYPVSEREAGSGITSVLDGSIAAVALWFCVYSLFLAPAGVGAGSATSLKLTELAYPALAVFAIGMIASVITRVSNEAARELVIICAGLVLLSVFKIAYVAQTVQTGSLRLDNWIGALSVLGLGVLLLATLPITRTPLSRQHLRRWLPALPFAPVAVAAVIGFVMVVRGTVLTGPEFAIGMLLLVAMLLRLLVGSRDRRALLHRLASRDQLFRSLVLDSSDLITLQTPDGRISYASPAMARFSGSPEDVLVGSRFDRMIEAADLPGIADRLADVRATPGLAIEFVCRIRSAEGNWRWMQTEMRNNCADPNVNGIVCNTRDIHDLYDLQQRLRYAAYHDALTGLGNLSQARELLARNCFGNTVVRGSVILVDLDGFKAINDTYGHPFGDRVLRVIAERLGRCATGTDIVTRIGGDEFLFVLEDEAATTDTMKRIMELYRKQVIIDGIELTVATSVGAALAVEASDSDELLRNADLAMYMAKSQGRNRAYFYEPYMFDASSHRMDVTRGLRRALDEGGLRLEYQPIVSLSDGSIVGCEALLRWDHLSAGLANTESFIQIAEESGLIIDIGAWVLDKLCADIAAWRAAGLTVPPVAMNVSRRQITPDLPSLIAAALAKYSLNGSDLCVEITESAMLAVVAEAPEILQQVRALGIAVALDDFGTGQSSVSQLTTLPIDLVKIDKSFVSAAGTATDSPSLVQSIVSLCANLSLPTVAEGIEDQATASELRSVGCEFGQGFYFNRPVTSLEFQLLLRKSVPGPRRPAHR